MLRSAALAVILLAGGVAAAEPARNSDGSPQVLPPGPPDEPGRTMVLAYDDFGPQAAAIGLLGPSYWSWTDCACFEPGDAFDVRIVVYRDVSRAHVEERYPVVRDRADYRYVPLADALAYFDHTLTDIAGDPDLATLTLELINTRARVIAALGR